MTPTRRSTRSSLATASRAGGGLLLAFCAAIACGTGGCAASTSGDGTGSEGSSSSSSGGGSSGGSSSSGSSGSGSSSGSSSSGGSTTDASTPTGPDATAGSSSSGGADASAPKDAGSDVRATADAGTHDASTTADAARPAEAGTVSGDAGNDPCGPNNPAVVPLPVFGTGAFDIRTYGAVGDGTTDNTTAIQAALTAAAAAGGGTVTVPSGTFLSGPIVVGNATNLVLAAGSTLKMLPMATYPMPPVAFITANNAHDIGITGSGTIEGQGQDWWNALTATPTLTRPQEVDFTNSARVLITGIRLQNPPEEHIWVKGDTNVTVTHITIQTLAVAGQHGPSNTDGVDIGANGVFFCGNNIACGDDNVVMSGTNIYVAYCNLGVGHGCSIGSITQNGVSGVTVDHVTFNGTTSGIRMKSARGRGGLVQNLTYSNITMTNVGNPLFITSYYPTLPTDPTTDPAQAVTTTTPIWKNITVQNMTATGSTQAGIIWGLPEEPVANLTLDNVSISAKTEMQIFHASGVTFTNGSKVTVTTAPAVVINDATVTGITTTNF